MSLNLVIRTAVDVDEVLFPNGVPPDSLVEVCGSSGSEKTFLLTYLLAKFLVKNSGKRAVFIDTTNHLRIEILQKFLRHLDPSVKGDEENSSSYNVITDPVYLSYLGRVQVIRCYSPEEMLFCFGPKNGAMLENMLAIGSDFAIVFIDCLDNFTYCPSLRGSDVNDFPDIVKLLQRNVAPTRTPVMCIMKDAFHDSPALRSLRGSSDADNNYFYPQQSGLTETSSRGGFMQMPFSPSQTSSSDIYNVPKPPEQALEPNFDFDHSVFTHSLTLKQVEGNEQGTFSAYLRCKKSPSMAFSVGSHCAKFSTLSGILQWIRE